MAVPTCILTNSGRRLPFFPHPPQYLVFIDFFYDDHSGQCEVIPLCRFLIPRCLWSLPKWGPCLQILFPLSPVTPHVDASIWFSFHVARTKKMWPNEIMNEWVKRILKLPSHYGPHKDKLLKKILHKKYYFTWTKVSLQMDREQEMEVILRYIRLGKEKKKPTFLQSTVINKQCS